MTILVTWTSWFIGYHLSLALMARWDAVIWIDNENDYYSVALKESRREHLLKNPKFKFYKWDLKDFDFVEKVFSENKVDKVCNLAAQAWVRYSLTNPFIYMQTNLIGFHNILECAKRYKVQNFVYASSSSVYGKNTKSPFSVEDRVDHPISLYAATKKANELIAHTYSHLYDLNTTWLRFFTVYWPYWRPDMAMYIFAKAISTWEKIDVFNHGKMSRDFTYIDDIVDGVIKSLDNINRYEVFNLWNDNPVELEYMIKLIEDNLWKKAIKNYMEIQPWDVPATWSDIDKTKKMLWWMPKTNIEDWIKKFVSWFKEYHAIK